MSTLAWLMRSTALMIIVGTLKDKMIEMNFHIIPFRIIPLTNRNKKRKV